MGHSSVLAALRTGMQVQVAALAKKQAVRAEAISAALAAAGALKLRLGAAPPGVQSAQSPT